MGKPTLVLGVGAMLAGIWADRLTGVMAEAGMSVNVFPLWSLVAVVLTTAPTLLVMIRTPKARSFMASLLGSILFALLVVMLTREAFDAAVMLDDASTSIHQMITENSAVIITACVVAALGQVLLHRKRPAINPDKKHKK